VLFSQLTAWGELLHPHQLEALALKATKDLAYKTALNPVGLDSNKRAFGSHNVEKTDVIVNARCPNWQAPVWQWG
jgi:hypothetical protein